MSTRGFNDLFVNYPRNAAVRRLRGDVHVAITQSLASMRWAQRSIVPITFESRRDMQRIVTAVDTLEVWMLKGTPPTVEEAVERIRSATRAPLRAYNEVAEARAGWRRRKGAGLTPAHFLAVKDAYLPVIDNLVTWLESVQPDRG